MQFAAESSGLLTPVHPARRAFDAGYADLIPIVPRDKRPAIGGWQSFRAAASDVDDWNTEGKGVGLRTRHYPAIDVDVDREDVSHAIVGALQSLFGGSMPPRRYGRPHRFAVPCRTDAPFGKIALSLSDAGGTQCGAVEVLGDGQQFVVHGVHPRTGQPYEWVDDTRRGDVALLADRAPDSLPTIDAGFVVGRLRTAIETAVQPFGLMVSAPRTPAKATPVDAADLLAPTVDDVRQVVAAIPNDATYNDRNAYVGFLAAIRGAVGPEQVDDGLEVAHEWAARWTGGRYDADETARTYASCHPPQLGWGYLLSQARRANVDTTPYEFPVDPTASVAEQIADTASEAEQIAALHGSAHKAVLLAAAIADIARIEGAAAKTHRLSATFNGAVLSSAKALKAFASDEFVFSRFLAPSLPTMPDADRALLCRAAWTLVAPPTHLAFAQVSGPGPALKADARERAWLIDGLLPRHGVGAIVGAPGKGKTFAAVALACSIVAGSARDGLGCDVPRTFADRAINRHGSVAYCASEDVYGVQSRIAAWEKANGAASTLRVFGNVPPLSDLSKLGQFMRGLVNAFSDVQVLPPALVVIDVFRAALAGKENDSDDVGPALLNAARIAQQFDCAIVIVHHTGRSAEHARGSNAFEAGTDFVAQVTKDGDAVTWRETRNKNAAERAPYLWTLTNGVLHGRGPVYTADAADAADTEGEQRALALAHTVHALAESGAPAKRGAVNDKLRTDYPALFPPGANISQSVTRACEEASRREWVSVTGAGQRMTFTRGLARLPHETRT